MPSNFIVDYEKKTTDNVRKLNNINERSETEKKLKKITKNIVAHNSQNLNTHRNPTIGKFISQTQIKAVFNIKSGNKSPSKQQYFPISKKSPQLINNTDITPFHGTKLKIKRNPLSIHGVTKQLGSKSSFQSVDRDKNQPSMLSQEEEEYNPFGASRRPLLMTDIEQIKEELFKE